MTIIEYLRDVGKSRAELAAEIGTSTAYLNHIIQGKHRKPSVKLAAKIIEISQGRVRLADLRPDIALLNR